jgi:hypothetical protein
MLYVVGIFGNPEVVKVFSEQIVTDYPELCRRRKGPKRINECLLVFLCIKKFSQLGIILPSTT